MVKTSGPKASWATYPKDYEDETKQGKAVEGLYESKYGKNHKYAGRVKYYYYKLPDGGQKSLGSNFKSALKELAIFQNKNKLIMPTGKPAKIAIEIPEPEYDRQEDGTWHYDGAKVVDEILAGVQAIKNGLVSVSAVDVTDEWWEYAERVIKNDLSYAAKMLRMPGLDRLDSLPPVVRSITLNECWNIYYENYGNGKIYTEEEKAKNRNLTKNVMPDWEDFSTIVKKKNVRDIDSENIKDYKNNIVKNATGYRPKYKREMTDSELIRLEEIQKIRDAEKQKKAKAKFDKEVIIKKNAHQITKSKYGNIKAVIDKAIAHYDGDKTDLNKLREKLNILEAISKDEESKLKIEKYHLGLGFQLLNNESLKDLLDSCDTLKDPLTKCMILFGINCAIRWEDLSKITFNMIERLEGFYVSYRSKNFKLQCSKLWNETIDAIGEYKAHRATLKIDDDIKDKDLLFITPFGNKWNDKDLRKRFDKVAFGAGNKWLTHNMLRQTFSTASAIQGYNENTVQFKIVMGREAPGADAGYIHGQAENTIDVIDKLHSYFFPSIEGK